MYDLKLYAMHLRRMPDAPQGTTVQPALYSLLFERRTLLI